MSLGLLAPLALYLVLLLLHTAPTAAVGAAATAATLVMSKPGGRSSESSASASGSDRDPPTDAAAEQASASLASALLPSSSPPASNSKAAPATQLHLVEVYENQRWTALGGWHRPSGEGKVRPWTYEDGGESLDPQRLRLPDGFEWCGSWRVLRTNGTDAKGWRYANRAQSFDSHHSGRRQRILSDRARRRRWVRPMRRAAAGAEGQGGAGAGVRQLRSVLLQGEIDMGAEAQDGTAAGGGEGRGSNAAAEALLLLLGEEGMASAELLAPPDRLDAIGAEALGDGPLGNLLLLGHAVQSAVRHAQEDFSFKGFGLTFVKSLVRRDFGFCFGIPMTPNFPSLERVDFLPTINTNVGVFYPFTLSGWCSISYPADLVFRLLAKLAPHIPAPSPDDPAAGTRSRYAATRAAAAAMADARRGLVATATAARARAKAAAKGLKVAASGAKKQKGGRRRRGSVERVGISISCRYNPSTGFFVRVTPWLFILPGLQLLARLLARLFNFLLGRVEDFEARTRRRAPAPAPAPEAQEKQEQTQAQMQEQQLLLASAYGRQFKKWLSKKTSGLGFSMALYKSGLGASVLVSLSPFFFGLRRPACPATAASATALGSAQLLMDDAAAPPAAAVAEPSIMMEESVSQPPLEPPAPAGKEGEEGDDEIPIPVLADGQEEGGEEGGRKGPASDDDKGKATGAGAAGGGAASSQRNGTPTSFSPGAGPQPDQQDGGLGGGLGEEAAGANTIGVA